MALHVPAPRINDIVRQRRAVTVDTALRLGRFFGVSAEFWMGLQADFDMARARDALAAELAAIDPWQAQQLA
jgi:addiction module HigA family antidote